MEKSVSLSVTSSLIILALQQLAGPKSAEAAFADWTIFARGGEPEPMCVDIPANLSLCHNIGYTKMRLPNLLDHDTMHEVSQQATSWVPLLNIKCHPDTQLFLCSLFAPVCLERPIYPCRSLCQKVKAGCEATMGTYGFPWPAMLECEKFPVDNDMCIASQSEKESETSPEVSGSTGEDIGARSKAVQCKAKTCNQPDTYENILDNFCQADFAVKMKFRRIRKRKLIGRNVRNVFKTWRGTPEELRQLRKPKILLDNSALCCSDWLSEMPRRERYLVMGKRNPENNELTATFILPWSRNEDMKRARRMFKRIDCSNLIQTSHMMMSQALKRNSHFTARHWESRRRRHEDDRTQEKEVDAEKAARRKERRERRRRRKRLRRLRRKQMKQQRRQQEQINPNRQWQF